MNDNEILNVIRESREPAQAAELAVLFLQEEISHHNDSPPENEK